MRVIVLTLAFFILLGINATCRQPGLTAANGSSPAGVLQAR